jgi:hypothetical protein
MKPKQANLGMKLELNANTLKAMLPVVQKLQPYIFGLLLVGVFGYTAYSVNHALNVQPAATQTAVTSLPKVTFDKDVMKSLRQRQKVDGQVPLNLGATDPF